MTDLPSRILVVTDRHQATASLPDTVAALLGAGLRWIWLRDRDLPPAERRSLARELAALTREAGAVLTIGADIDLAESIEARSVQLRSAAEVSNARRRLGARALIGVSAHALGDIRDAGAEGADYATLSPIFASASKPGYGPALGLAALRETAAIDLPVVALGGVTAANMQDCLGAGASAVAIMGAAMRRDTAVLALIRRS